MWHLFSALHLSLALLSSLQEPPLLLWCSFSCATFSPASSFLLYVAPQTCFFRAGLPLLILASVPSNFRNCAVCILLYGVSFFTWLFRWDSPPPSFFCSKEGWRIVCKSATTKIIHYLFISRGAHRQWCMQRKDRASKQNKCCSFIIEAYALKLSHSSLKTPYLKAKETSVKENWFNLTPH